MSSSGTRRLIREAFGKDCSLYEVLGVKDPPSECTASKLRRAYYRAALQHHPDKNSSEESTRKFQAISLAYQILSNPARKQAYDDTGDMHDDDDEDDEDAEDFGSGDAFEKWTKFFGAMFGKVTTRDISDFEAKYKYSDEEEADVLQYYEKFKGNARKMLECVLCSSETDVPRWMEDYIRPAMERGDVPDYGMSTAVPDKKNKKKKKETPTATKKKKKKKKDEVKEEQTDDEDDDEEDETFEDADEEDETEEDKSTETDEEEDDEDEDEEEPVPKSRSKRKQASRTPKAPRKSDKVNDMSALVAKIRGGNKKRPPLEDLLSGLEQRYSKKSKQKPAEDIPDEEFERIRANLDKKRKSKPAPPRRPRRKS